MEQVNVKIGKIGLKYDYFDSKSGNVLYKYKGTIRRSFS